MNASQSSRTWKGLLTNDLAVLILIALAWLLLLTGLSLWSSIQHGFHRDELAFIENARHLAWGYIEYPPLTPAIAALPLALFGPSQVGLRFFVALAVCVTLVLVGWMARDMGGSRRAQIVAMLGVAIAPMVLSNASFFSYETFDYLWWVLVAFGVVRLLKTENPRWWLLIGAAIGLGMMTKYTMAVYVLGLGVGVLFTPARRWLKSPWLWAGALLAVLIVTPTLIWQIQHHFIALQFTSAVHARDVRIGRTSGFLLGQLYITTNPATLVMWVTGLNYLLRVPAGRTFRPLGWMFVTAFLVFLLAQGRDYYLAPAYPALIAAGACQITQAFSGPFRIADVLRRPLYAWMVFGGLFAMLVTLPLAPVGSAWWNFSIALDTELREEIGWPELVQTVASIRDNLPAAEQSKVGILASNYGEAGAISLYGPTYHLPQVISGADSFWLRGYGQNPPQTLIVLGMDRAAAEKNFETCTLAGQITNRFGVLNEETRYHPDIFLCRNLRQPWPEFWKNFLAFM